MKKEQIAETLASLFKNNRIIFWYDETGEFSETINSLELSDVSTIRLDETGQFAAKIRVEHDEPEKKFLLYAPYVEPSKENNWLLDIKLYSHTFHADMASIILDDLGLRNRSLKAYIQKRMKFFASAERQEKLKKWLSPQDMEDEIDLKMLVVCSKATQPNDFAVLINLLDGMCEDGKYHPAKESKIWDDIKKLGLEDSFWKIIKGRFGYDVETNSLNDLILKILVTDFCVSIEGDVPEGLKHLILTSKAGEMNSAVFISQWRNDMEQCLSYDYISSYYSRELKVAENLSSVDVKKLLEASTFEVVEKVIITSLVEMIKNASNGDFKKETGIINSRLDKYWVKNEKKLYSRIYNALNTIIGLFELRWKYDKGFNYPDADTMYNAYAEELYLFDQKYRQYHYASDLIEAEGFDVLKTINELAEACYSEWYLKRLSISWGAFIDNGLLKKMPGYKQHLFYHNHVKPYIDKQDKNRIFVIISDAFRYEAAEELTRKLNGKYRLQAELDKVTSVLPSYTALGMGALLPHKTLNINDKAEVLVNDKLIDTIEKRNAVLDTYKGIAVKASDLMAMKKDSGREYIKDKKIVYIYHNEIDSTGDTASSEKKTFHAVERTIDELEGLCSFIINNLNGNRVIVTADHGFVFCEKDPESFDKSTLETKPANAIKAKKRYIIGKDLGHATNVWAGDIKDTAGTVESMEFWLPKGMNRFHFSGGAKYFHGGAMLQEIMVPVVTVSQVKGKDVGGTVVEKVGVSILSSAKKVVTNIARFEFIQTEAVSERRQPNSLTVFLCDEKGLISNEETLTFDSISESLDDRKKSVSLKIMGGSYNPKKDYYLVMRDAVTSIEYERIPIKIDLAISNIF